MSKRKDITGQRFGRLIAIELMVAIVETVIYFGCVSAIVAIKLSSMVPGCVLDQLRVVGVYAVT